MSYSDCDPCECQVIMTRYECILWEIAETYEERAWETEGCRYRDYVVEDWLNGASPETLKVRYF